jgi:hypothetical protein
MRKLLKQLWFWIRWYCTKWFGKKYIAVKPTGSVSIHPIEKPKELTVKVNNLDDYLNSKYQYRLNTEVLRQELLMDIENWYLQNKDLWEWERNENYRKSIREQIRNAQLNYYTILVNQSGLDEKTQRDMISKYGTGRTENEWKALCN